MAFLMRRIPRSYLNYKLIPHTRPETSCAARKMSTTTPKHDSQPPFDAENPIKSIQPPNPTWKFGDGITTSPSAAKHISIDPSDPTRPPAKNYKFLISSIVPRPIALISTKCKETSALNLAPFSYFQVINHDPPMFVVSFVPPGSRSPKAAKDTLRNLLETQECVINVVSEHMLQAVNATAVNAEYGDSEFDVSGLTPSYDTTTTTKNNIPRVLESIVSIEGRLVETREYPSRANPDAKIGNTTLAIIEGTKFWVREDAIDESELAAVDLQVLRPVGRLGGDKYGRTTEVVEIERPLNR